LKGQITPVSEDAIWEWYSDLSENGQRLGRRAFGWGQGPINSKLAGQMHPSGVWFDEFGFPDFGPHSVVDVQVPSLTGSYSKDAGQHAAGLASTPSGYVWHHVEDGVTM
jgi:hypothetical protein